MEERRVSCELWARWCVEGWRALCLNMYYPVNYVEIERSGDVFLGSRDEAVSII